MTKGSGKRVLLFLVVFGVGLVLGSMWARGQAKNGGENGSPVVVF